MSEDDYRLIYICGNGKVEKPPENVYLDRKYAESFFYIVPEDMKAKKQRTKDQWIEWHLKRCDEVWITDGGDYELEKEFAKNNNVYVREYNNELVR